MSGKIAIALVGIGKIARDQHLPTLARSADFELLGAASPSSTLADLPCFRSIEALLDALPAVQALALCTTPQARFEPARYALERGCHVLLEKPPGATLSEVQALTEIARQRGCCLFAAWHSRFAVALAPARAWLASRRIRLVTVTWKEDVRYWHPGQTWIWRAGGLGVFDPVINALSILTELLPATIRLCDAELSFPENCDTPIAGRLELRDGQDTPIQLEMDFLQTGPPTWDIVVDTSDGRLVLSKGGSVLRINDGPASSEPNAEYPALYAHFAQLLRSGRIDADVAPLRLVADAMLCGRRIVVEPFIE